MIELRKIKQYSTETDSPESQEIISTVLDYDKLFQPQGWRHLHRKRGFQRRGGGKWASSATTRALEVSSRGIIVIAKSVQLYSNHLCFIVDFLR